MSAVVASALPPVEPPDFVPPLSPPAFASPLPAGAGLLVKPVPLVLVLVLPVPQAARTAVAPTAPAPSRTSRRGEPLPGRAGSSAGSSVSVVVCTSVIGCPPVHGPREWSRGVAVVYAAATRPVQGFREIVRRRGRLFLGFEPLCPAPLPGVNTRHGTRSRLGS